jgi:hypothetical protein
MERLVTPVSSIGILEAVRIGVSLKRLAYHRSSFAQNGKKTMKRKIDLSYPSQVVSQVCDFILSNSNYSETYFFQKVFDEVTKAINDEISKHTANQKDTQDAVADAVFAATQKVVSRS